MAIDFGNIQGIVTQIYRYPISRHLLFSFSDQINTRRFLQGLLPHVTTSETPLEAKPEPLLNLGISYHGLVALGLEREFLEALSTPFIEGPDPVALGDAKASRSAPANWWEGQFATEEVHCILHLYFLNDVAVEPTTEAIRAQARNCGVRELIPRRDGTCLDGRSLGGRKLHFGYTDGISHPDICWNDEDHNPGQINYRHFLLGYSQEAIPSFPQSGAAAELMRDSSYEVFRWIYQDVATFNRFLREEGPRLAPDLPPQDAEELLAAKMMGRWRDGTPLVLSPDKPVSALSESNGFLYAESDPNGFKCPFSSHIRVVNPRDQELDPVVVEPVPQVIRRGMPYGPPLQQDEDNVDRGIIGMFLCSDIRRQFYTMTRWIKQNTFSPVFDGNRRVQDPLMGNRHIPGTTADFIIPSQKGSVTIKGLPEFIHTIGTALFLLPSCSTLKALTR